LHLHVEVVDCQIHGSQPLSDNGERVVWYDDGIMKMGGRETNIVIVNHEQERPPQLMGFELGFAIEVLHEGY
jgi:hypothetical protein